MRRLEQRLAQEDRRGGGGTGLPRPAPVAGAVSRRRHPDLVTAEPDDDDEDVFGDAWPLVDEWRGLWDGHPARGRGLAWVSKRERILEVEVALLEEHGLTLPPETEPLRGLDRGRAVELASEGAAPVQEAAGQAGVAGEVGEGVDPGRVA